MAEQGPLASRRSLGAYYTPADIARTLTEWTLKGNVGPVLDPSYGICRFLDAALDVLSAAGVAHPERAIHGVDVDATATSLTTLKLVARGAQPTQFVHRDFFAVEPDPRYAAIVGNPPYVRHHWQDDVVKTNAEAAMAKAGLALSGLASLWAPFVVHASAFSRSGGRLAMLLPGSAIQAQYAWPVWRHLSTKYATVTLVRVGERAFPDALEETVVALLDRRTGTGSRKPLAVDVASFNALAEALAEPSAVAELRKRGRHPRRVRGSLTTRRLLDIAGAHDASAQLGEVAKVRLGTVTGANRFFLRSADDPLLRELPESDRMPVVPNSRSLRGAVWTPRDNADVAAAGKRCCLLQLSPESPAPPLLQEALKQGKAASLHERSHCRRRDHWWAIPASPPADAFLAYMTSSPRGIVENAASAGCINGVHRVTWSVPDGSAYLLSSWTSLWALCVEQLSRHYAGGVLKLEPGTAPRLPVIRHENRADLTEIDSILRNGSLSDAREFADDTVLGGTLGFSGQQIRSLQAAVSALAERRSLAIRESHED